MYEVFLNASRLILAGNDERPILDEKAKMRKITTREELTREVEQFRSREQARISEQCGECASDTLALVGDLPLLLEWFRAMFRPMPAAGGIVRSDLGMLFIYRRGKWDLPKGKIEKRETSLEAALREVTEETGLTQLEAGTPLPSTFHIYLSDYPGKPHEWILKETCWFAMQASGEEQPHPETAENIEEVRWFRPQEMDVILDNTYASLRELIRQLPLVSTGVRAGGSS